ncbi:MAG: hypothetical protein KJO69_07020, partial [Gammaproteobacteria bacterium]|nr:hypothetical protein [Gammaproteobacteria bacterium]
FLPYTSEYLLVDKYGKKTHSGRTKTLSNAVDHLLDVISTADRKEIGRTLERDASRIADSVQVDQDYLDKLMEETSISRKLFINDINSNVTEYHETRMNKNMISKLWSIPLGRSITYPSKYLGGGLNKLMKIFGKDREATFVTGYTFNDQIDIEIWLVKSLITGKGTFYVFDITSAKLIDSKIPNLRRAYASIANKISVKA